MYLEYNGSTRALPATQTAQPDPSSPRLCRAGASPYRRVYAFVHNCAIRCALALMLCLCFAGTASAVSAERIEKDNRIKDSIVKIYTVVCKPDYIRPWNMFTSRGSGSGCIIGRKRILTNAHVVADHTFIEVRRYGKTRRYTAEVLAVSHEADLAVLGVADDEFFEDAVPLEFGELPSMQEEVVVYGFPMGGDTLSVTKGVVSRIEHRHYAHSSEYLLAAQIDAAINPGNSGGPVLVDDRIVGVVMQMYTGAENIGYMVPVPVVRHFLEDIKDGQYNGFPAVGMVLEDMENPDIKRMYGMPDEGRGVLVRHVFPWSSAHGIVKKNDIIVGVDGHPVADDGTVEFREKERTSLTYYIDAHQMGDRVGFDVVRDSISTNVVVALKQQARDFQLVPGEQYDALPRYFVYGGIVFSTVTHNLLKSWGGNWRARAPRNLVALASEWPTEDKREVVVALQVLADEVNKGYHDVSSWVVERVNGKTFTDFDEFHRLVTQSDTPFMVFEDRHDYQVVLDNAKAEEAADRILRRYRISSGMSKDLAPGEE